MLAITVGDHAATRFDTTWQFAENTIAFTHRALAHGAQVMVVPAARQVTTTQRLVIDAAPAIWRAAGEGQIQFAEPGTLRLSPALHQLYAQRTQAAVDSGYSGLWVSVDMSWAADCDPEQLIAFEAGAYRLFDTGRLTALCQYPTAHYTDSHIRRACQAHPASHAGVRVRHEFGEQGRLLRLWGETDLTNTTAFGVLVAAVPEGGTIDVTGMWFIDVRGLSLLARSTRRTPPTAIACTAEQSLYLQTLGAAVA